MKKSPDRICLVTGANSGIGFETARALAGSGHTVILQCRTEEKAHRARQAITEATGNSSIDTLVADLASQSQIREAAASLADRYSRLDVLVNNAGTWKSDYELTEDGVESVWAVNHLAYFLLTHEAWPLLQRSGEARIINVSSDSHFQIKGMFWDDLMLENNYHGLRSYAQSKMANVYFTYEFDRRCPADHVTINAVQPGLVQTDIGLKHTNWLHALAWRVRRRMWGHKTPAEGAATSIYLAQSEAAAGQSGQYWDNCRPKPSAAVTYEEEAAARLWEESCRQCGIEDYFATR